MLASSALTSVNFHASYICLCLRQNVCQLKCILLNQLSTIIANLCANKSCYVTKPRRIPLRLSLSIRHRPPRPRGLFWSESRWDLRLSSSESESLELSLCKEQLQQTKSQEIHTHKPDSSEHMSSNVHTICTHAVEPSWDKLLKNGILPMIKASTYHLLYSFLVFSFCWDEFL